MARTVVVSLEDDRATVLYGSYKRGRVSIDDALRLGEDGLDDFLAKEKTREFVVVKHFRESHQDTVVVPNLRGGYLRRVVASEAARISPYPRHCFTFIAGEPYMSGERKVRDVFLYIVDAAEAEETITRFAARNKVVRALIPDALAVASLMRSALPASSTLCVFGSGVEKGLLFVDEGRLRFVRFIQSHGEGLDDFDVANINITINYCRQKLKASPSALMLVGEVGRNYSAETQPLVAAACMLPVHAAPGAQDAYLDLAVPLSAFFAERDLDVSPPEYERILWTRRFLRSSAVLWAGMAVVCAIYAAFMFQRLSWLNERLDELRAELRDIDAVMASYEETKARFEGYRAFVELFNSGVSEADVASFLAVLSEVTPRSIDLASYSLEMTAEGLKARLDGRIKGRKFVSLEVYYRDFIEAIESRDAMEVRSSRLELSDRSFVMEVLYR
ncbi:MAG TPA: hypothetical protein ENJ37_01210 [Deltaproteobacteria bacterium]|nr:hypothetical protein [Deltaproteobacteria bacterium]